jgi:hypothetical protein
MRKIVMLGAVMLSMVGCGAGVQEDTGSQEMGSNEAAVCSGAALHGQCRGGTCFGTTGSQAACNGQPCESVDDCASACVNGEWACVPSGR